jgi:hypothetical protein
MKLIIQDKQIHSLHKHRDGRLMEISTRIFMLVVNKKDRQHCNLLDTQLYKAKEAI